MYTFVATKTIITITTPMKNKKQRLETLKMLISSKELGSQGEVLKELAAEGFEVTQATLSRDLKQLKVAKAASMNGSYVYVLPNETMYKRITKQESAHEMLITGGILSVQFSHNICVIHTRAGYASAIAFNIDHCMLRSVIGTIAGDDAIILVLSEHATREQVLDDLKEFMPENR